MIKDIFMCLMLNLAKHSEIYSADMIDTDCISRLRSGEEEFTVVVNKKEGVKDVQV